MANCKRKQAGFTLIEVLLVVGIIGMLTCIMMPSVRGYQARAKVTEAMLLLTQCRNIITEIYTSGADRLPGLDNWGCESEKPSRYVERIRTTNEGIIKLTMGNEVGDLRLAIHDITLAPLNSSNRVMGEDDLGSPVKRWRCGFEGDGTDVPTNFLPSSCRGV
jgi:type IV pilus assembly protein PilA